MNMHLHNVYPVHQHVNLATIEILFYHHHHHHHHYHHYHQHYHHHYYVHHHHRHQHHYHHRHYHYANLLLLVLIIRSSGYDEIASLPSVENTMRVGTSDVEVVVQSANITGHGMV
jgi:hypothetical protein